MKQPTPFDMEMLARTLFAEFSGEGPQAMQAGAWSIANRWRAGRWNSGVTLADTCLYPEQYSSWNTHDNNRRRLAQVDTNDVILNNARAAALNAVLQRGTDPTNGATHYYSTKIMPTPPAWALPETGAVETLTIGNTKFFSGVK